MPINSINRRSFLILSFGVLVNYAFGKGTSDSRNLFVYYTRTLNTHMLVSYMQSLIGGDVLRINTAQNYPKNYQQMVALASKQRIENILPPLTPYSFDLASYDNIFIAAPLWGMDLCAPMKSFLSHTNLNDKRVYGIVTNAGYGLGESVQSMKKFIKTEHLAGILDYQFKNYEKIVPNLFSLNKRQISQNKAFKGLDKAKITSFLTAFYDNDLKQRSNNAT